jgi:hypothetical protein
MKIHLPNEIWEACLKNGSLQKIEHYLAENSAIQIPADLDYPFVHRICDFELNGQAYRLLREVVNNTENLFMLEWEYQNAGENIGVPYPLKGESLKRWMNDENDEDLDTDCTTPWGNYLDKDILKQYINELKPIILKQKVTTDYVVESDGVIVAQQGLSRDRGKKHRSP